MRGLALAGRMETKGIERRPRGEHRGTPVRWRCNVIGRRGRGEKREPGGSTPPLSVAQWAAVGGHRKGEQEDAQEEEHPKRILEGVLQVLQGGIQVMHAPSAWACQQQQITHKPQIYGSRGLAPGPYARANPKQY